MGTTQDFSEQIEEIIRANGWDGKLIVEKLPPTGGSQTVRIRLSDDHPTAPSDVVNVYVENTHTLEQVMQECLRALRTGRPGV